MSSRWRRRLAVQAYIHIGKEVNPPMMTRLFIEEEGQTLIEYGLLTALIAVVAIAILSVLGRKTRDVYVTVSENMRTQA